MGAVISFYKQQWPPASQFSVDDMPDLSGKVVVVTGGNSGIGYETAKALLLHNAKVYIACRSEAKANEAIARLAKECDGKLALFHPLDLADLAAVKASGQSFLSKEKELHILFNNAGVMIPPKDQFTADGYDLTLGVNVLGPFLFTNILLPVLLAAAESSGDARVVNTSSFASELTTRIDYDAFKEGPKRRATDVQELYNQSKLGNLVFSNELAHRFGSRGLTSTALNPGNIQTELGRHMNMVMYFFVSKIVWPAPMGALTQLYAGTSPEGRQLNGKYLAPWARVHTANPASQDRKFCEELWTFLEEEVKGMV